MSDDIDAVIEEILVDAYGEDEQLWAIRQFFEDEAVFPFPAEVVVHDHRDGRDALVSFVAERAAAFEHARLRG